MVAWTGRGAARKGYIIEDGPEGRTLVVTGDWSDRAARVLASGQADGLVLNYARGYRERTLDFLRPWPVRRLQILARTITNIEPVYQLAETLEDLGLRTRPMSAGRAIKSGRGGSGESAPTGRARNCRGSTAETWPSAMRDSGLVVAGQPLVAEDHVVALDYGQFSLCTATGIPDELVGVVERALYLARP